MQSIQLNEAYLRSKTMDPQHPFAEDENLEEDQEKNTDYFASGTICAVAADVQSNDPFFFVTIIEECYAKCDIMDDYKNIIPAGQRYLPGHYLEKGSRSPKGDSYRIYNKKIVHFYPESITFPFVPFQETHKGKKNTLILSNEDYCDIIYFTEETKMGAFV